MARYANTGGYVVLEGEIVTVTDKAVLVSAHDLGEEVWVPKSQIAEDDEVDVENMSADEINITYWFADRIGLPRRKK